MGDKPTLSIVTPTYNRGDLLRRCYESLLRQTSLDFEWIIVDDGSSDNTEEIVTGFTTALFPVIYVQKSNGGKHTALNAAHPYIRGKYVLILDSDDRLTETAVNKVLLGWREYEKEQSIGVVTFLRGSIEGQAFCTVADKDEKIPVDAQKCKRICLVSSDCCEVIRTELLKKYPFPEYEGERFISEGALWHRVGFTHKYVYINEIVYIGEYLEGGLTSRGRAMRIHCPLGGMYNSDLLMDRRNPIKTRIKSGLLFTSYGFFAKLTPKQMAKKCRAKALMWLCLPFGWAMYKLWKKKYAQSI